MTPTPVKTTTTDKKDVQKLQRAIIDGLEDVKAQDIQVFDTEHITSLFERVIIASGTSNRQTKALAASVRDAVRDAGFAKPRIEGEENGEWIIVDCGSAVAHIMQPTIRQYYHLEELWGDKPVKLKLGAPTPLAKAAKVVEEVVEPAPKRKPAAKTAVKVAAKKGGRAAAKTSKSAVVKPLPPMPTMSQDPNYIGRVGKTNDWTAKRNATETALEPVAKPAARKTAVKTAAKPAAKSAVKIPLVKVPVAKKAAAAKVAAKTAAKPVAGKPAAKKVAVKKPAAKKTAPRSA
ncbi:MAG: ribosome silencing factor [Polaromonas sp.]